MGIGGRGVGWALIVQAQLGARRQRQIPSRARRRAQRALLHADAAKPVFLSHAVAAGARLDVAVTRAHHEGPRLPPDSSRTCSAISPARSRSSREAALNATSTALAVFR